MAPSLTPPRLTLRRWGIDDAAAAVGIYGHSEVAGWLSPMMDRVPDVAGMRLLLQQWIAEDARAVPPAGRWAIHRGSDDRVIGGVYLLPLPPGRDDLEIGWQLHPEVCQERHPVRCRNRACEGKTPVSVKPSNQRSRPRKALQGRAVSDRPGSLEPGLDTYPAAPGQPGATHHGPLAANSVGSAGHGWLSR